eukprot:TRINITY_DN29183_c0_g1_i1.p1 TRINITY_DN29183_c0_g1~~TRINITY_DN29183_c0_g1_i1.p1  ORF type:complete len:277 (+),score=60.83 TRINITY_DN29183_c0_g1_i1:31-861(+)
METDDAVPQDAGNSHGVQKKRNQFQTGDIVCWIGDDAEVPRGTRGTVRCTMGTDKAEVRFPSGKTLVMRTDELFCPDSLPRSFSATFQPGKVGIAGDFDGSGMVWQVVPDSQADHLGVKLGMYFHTVSGLPFTEELLVQHIEGSSEYTIVFGNEPSAALPSNQKLKPGQKVVLRGLQSKQELNGKRGRLEKFVSEKGRWQVLVDGSRKLFKEENLELEAAVKRGFLHRNIEKEQQKAADAADVAAEDKVIWLAAAGLVAALAVGGFLWIRTKGLRA